MHTDLWKPLLLVTVVLILPLAVVAFWGEPLGEQLAAWRETPPPRVVLAALVVALLAADVFLPIPSGPLCTLAGSQLGIWLGTLVGCVGMTLGAAIAFGLARRWGRPLAVRFASENQLQQLDAACANHGPAMLALTRPLPVVAEACALLVGALRMPWRQFVPVVVLSNVALAACYASLGQYAVQHGWLPLAVCLSIALPLLALWWWRKREAALL